ncbi:hypothetical protein [Candidatus Symbiopectobacterium sp. 'North America']|uniref:hypothetical protein n=1 Tax=Candidatus Symbiopectobacterium sp. 'North America' TaxID=2794574 RepID=UPI0018CAC6CE|nr:hypothetical protein [Candidatus Symbiopectobacterium sp. 'North America']
MSVNLNGVSYNNHSNVFSDEMNNVKNKQSEAVLEKKDIRMSKMKLGKNFINIFNPPSK